MPKKICCLFILLFICLVFPSLSHADNQTVFGPKDCKIGRWKNTPEKQIRGGFILFNTTIVPLRNFLTGNEVVFEKEITLRSINFITIFLRGTPGTSVTITINSGGTSALPPEVTFSADPQTIALGESSTLAWNVINADNIRIDPDIGSVDPNGSFEVFPTETTI
ncbi:MAG: hypothetical protein JRI69_03005 [Deltaproteobacteria bacterium]|nr:hypothetical protein [Deltaproteobacteria bacterium]